MGDRQALVEAPRVLFSVPVQVAFQHVDAAGIVFFARVFEYVHDAYVAWLAQVGCPLPQWLSEGSVIAPLTHAEADYLAPLRFGDTGEVQLVAVEAEGSRMTLGWRIAAGNPETVCVVGRTVHVCVDRATFRRAPLPAPLADAVRVLGEPSPRGGTAGVP